MIKVFTDGSATSVGVYTGLGGWAYTINSNQTNMDIDFEDAGGVMLTTSNRMEIEAVIQALKQLYQTKHLYDGKKVMFYSDSQLVVQTLCKNPSYSQKKNIDKWMEVNKLMNELRLIGFDIDFQWIKGHDNKNTSELAEGNKKVDKLATRAKEELKKKLEYL